VGAWAYLIYFLSDISGLSSGFGVWDFVLRKGAHMFEFAVLTFLTTRAVRHTWPTRALKTALIWGAGFALLYAGSDEFHQSFVPGRTPDVKDVLVDAVGILFAVALLKRYGRQDNVS